MEFDARMRREFVDFAALGPNHYVIIDGNQSIEVIRATAVGAKL
jgi:hypothetical protein